MRRAFRWLLRGIGAVAIVLVALIVAVELYYGHKIFAALPHPKLPRLEPIASLGTPSAANCGACHAQIAAEWRASAHGQAMHDDLFLAESDVEHHPHFCIYCHAPLVEQQPVIFDGLLSAWPRQLATKHRNPHFQPGLTDEGVTCVVCHQRGAEIVGPHHLSGAPHPTKADASFGNPSLCATCHTLDIALGGPLLRPVQDTLAEWEEYRAAGGEKQCIDCHMPDVGSRPLVAGYAPRPSRSHAFRGPSDVEFLRTGIVVEGLDVKKINRGAVAHVQIFNGSGHRIPTAEPHRRVQIEFEALDENNLVLRRIEQRIERRIDTNRLVEPPGSDSTLRPRETRKIELLLAGPLPASARRLQISVVYYLWDPDDEVPRRAGRDENSLRRIVGQALFALP